MANARQWTDGLIIVVMSLGCVASGCGSTTVEPTGSSSSASGAGGGPSGSTSGAGGGNSCDNGTTRCDDVCVDLTQDPVNCGACGKTCPGGEACADSDCVVVLPQTFKATIQNASRDGMKKECLIFSDNGQQENPERYLWGDVDNSSCGLTQTELLMKKEAIWKFKSLGGNAYTISNASKDGTTEECLIFDDNGMDEVPTRQLWNGGDNGFCGLSSDAELLMNKQAVWRLTPLAGNAFRITNASKDDKTEECLIFGANGTNPYPTRHLWGPSNDYCGFASKDQLLTNKQAVFYVTILP